MKHVTNTNNGTPLMKKTGKYLLMTGLALMLAAGSFAQPTGGDGGGGSDGNPDQNVPFDGGISILVAAGISYGIKKRHDQKQKSILKEK